MNRHRRPSAWVRWARTPKGLFALILALITAVALSHEGWRLAAPGLVAAMGAAMLVDAPLLRWRTGRWHFPDGAMLTGWLVALILSPHESYRLAAITAVVGVASKHLVRARKANVFNPAALALVATFHLFDTGQSWWGALPELPLPYLGVVFATGLFITLRLNKLPVVLAFLGGYYALATVAAFVGDPGHVAELYREPDLHAAIFFAFFMLTDPPTSPPRHRDQLVYGAIVAAVAFAVFETVGAAYFLLAGLLVANVWEGWRRSRPVAAGARAR